MDGGAQAGLASCAIPAAAYFAAAETRIQYAQANRTDFGAVNVRPSGFILAMVVLGGGLLASATGGQGARSGFPLSPGTEWIYRGFVRSPDEDSTVGKVTGVTWKMSVVRTVERDGILAAVVSGFPGDLNWSEGDAQPQLSMLIETDDSKFYLNSEWNTQAVKDQLDNPKYPLRELVETDDWFLQLPLVEGKKFCDEQAMARDDGEYCWVAGPPHPADLHGVKGVAAPGARNAYELRYATNPDDTEIEFVEGIGITSYEYHHHGTVAETDVHLIEFHPAESAGR